MLPDYMFVFAIAQLTHDVHFTDVNSVQQLKAIERCLWLVLEPLVHSKDDYSFNFYKNMIDRIKRRKDTLRHDDHETNVVSLV